ncbi:hypothetical protein KJ680_00715, partial [bacterium]|nr:hypothetical protein [bacterium]
AYATVLENEAAGELAISYYFFYPRSNWGEHGGYNDHEGDWEGCTIFFKKATDGNNTFWVPDRVALSQHERRFGLDASETDGVDIADWDAIAKNDYHIKARPGLGGHALYADKGEIELGELFIQKDELFYGNGDKCELNGKVQYLSRIGTNEQPSWLTYVGDWGKHDLNGHEELLNTSGDNAPSGPAIIDNGSRWYNPWDWSFNYRP